MQGEEAGQRLQACSGTGKRLREGPAEVSAFLVSYGLCSIFLLCVSQLFKHVKSLAVPRPSKNGWSILWAVICSRDDIDSRKSTEKNQ